MFEHVKGAIANVQCVASQAIFYSTTLKDRAKLRRAFLTLERAVEIAGNADTFEDARPALEAAMMATFSDSDGGNDCHISEAVNAVVASESTPSGPSPSHPTGFSRFDGMFKRTHAPTETNMIVIAGKSGEGKSSLALSIVLNAAQEGTPCKIYSMEMDRNDIAVRAGHFFARNTPSFDQAMQEASRVPLWLSDKSDRTVESVRSDIRLSALRHGVKIVIVDYIQLLGTSAGKDKENRERQVAAMSRMLKVAAMESKVLVYALSQLNDEGKLRESRAIEQDADAVVYVVAKNGNHYLWVSKNRRGARHGEVKDMPEYVEKAGIRLDFDASNYRFHQF